MIEHPKTAEEFYTDYKDFVYEWISMKNYQSSIELNKDDFFSGFIDKVIKENTMDKFDPERGFQFKTWLSKVLRYHYLTLIEKATRSKWISIDKDPYSQDGEDNKSIELKDDSKDYLEEIITENAINQLMKIIDSIDENRDRVLIKLKHIDPKNNLMTLNENDIAYIESLSGKNAKEIGLYIEENAKESIGLKEKSISQLLGMPLGSVGVNFQRAVSKWLKE
tara:strand:- start:185 stop:850 length:666 start_codon:yes stop_codon:yes gene_type:complete